MKFTQLLLSSALLSLPVTAFAEEGASAGKTEEKASKSSGGSFAAKETTCKQGETTRKVKLDYKDASSGADCSVSYLKENEQAEKLLWSAQKQPEFCKEKADAFVEKLKGMGWACD